MAIAVLPPLHRTSRETAEIAAPWVSTDLRILHPDPTWRLAPDFTVDARCYRKLDPAYFAWLRRRMLEVRAAHKAGRVSLEAFDELRTRFNGLQELAIAVFGEKALQEAIRASGVADYRPPVADALSGRSDAKQPAVPEQAAWPDSARSRASTEAAVDAIRDQALAHGWTHERLYGRLASDQLGQRGDLVTALLRPGTRIGQITRQWIAIIGPPPHENVLQLYNPEVEQPWVTTAAGDS